MLDENGKERVKALFSEYMELLDNRKQLNDQIKELMESVAELFNVKKALVAKVFSFLKKKYEDGSDELDDIVTIFQEIEG